MPTMSEQLAAFADGLTLDTIPAEIKDKAKLHILDVLGVGLVGTRFKPGQIVRDTTAAWGGTAESSLLADLRKLPAPNAAFVNGSLMHGLDFDDTHDQGGAATHPSSPVVPALLAAGEPVRSSGGKFLVSSIVGFEIITRLATAARGGVPGFHPTGVCGAPAAAYAVGKLYGLGADQLADTAGIACTFSSGMAQTIRDGSWSKQLNAGRAANSGVIAAQLSRNGFTATHGVFEDTHGYFETFGRIERFEPERLVGRLGENWEIPNIEFKHFPSGFHGHYFLDAATYLKEKHSIKYEDIDHIVYGDTTGAITRASEPVDRKRRPESGYAAKFSRYFTIALIFARDTPRVEDFEDENIYDERVLALGDRISYVVDDQNRWLRVHMKNGEVFERIQNTVEPLDETGVVAKFRTNIEGVLSSELGDWIIKTVLSVEKLADIGELARACAGVPAKELAS